MPKKRTNKRFVQSKINKRKVERQAHARMRALERYGIDMTMRDFRALEQTLRYKPRVRTVYYGTAIFWGPGKDARGRYNEYWRFLWKGHVLDAIVGLHTVEGRANKERRGYNGIVRKIQTFLPNGTFEKHPNYVDKEPWHYQKLPRVVRDE
jgi:hypothetical protein